ncbi:hypothetical protein CY0110_18637 [Crocosphaera chwakensis CCY0110]|uniref:Uncharacterized protein n=1 Tax=Crocosphaera chwakensis CCY0110 TaxID=391612 RepID=A3IJ59_9CHRO|nr:hypothetical protein CY0110_18637 [Crocosphaera chwakensis CCY0110]
MNSNLTLFVLILIYPTTITK